VIVSGGPPGPGAGWDLSYQPGILQGLWEAVPSGMRLAYYSASTVPEEYRGGLAHQRGRAAGVDLSPLPAVIRQELAWCMFRIITQGGKVDVTHMRALVRRLGEVLADLGPAAPASLTGLAPREWQQQFALAVRRRTGALPGPGSISDLRQQLGRCWRLLAAAYDTRPWWQREIWNPAADPRIPQRVHEPRRHAANFGQITTGWLRLGLQWHCKVGLEAGTLAWGTAELRVAAATVFDAFLAGRAVPGPHLADEPAQLRALMLDYLGHLRGMRVQRPGKRHGQPLSDSRVAALMTGIEQFYAFMHDHRDTAAAALAAPGWLRLEPQHAVFFRRGEKPRKRRRGHDRDVIDDDALTQIMAGAGLLGAPPAEGGLGDEQAMRILMLLARTGRRVSEICLLDRDPLLPAGPAASGRDSAGFTARLRYQQTKIEGAPDTILVDEEIVAIIRAQQQWADRFLSASQSPVTSPKYLFLAARNNRHGDRPYSAGRLRDLLAQLARRLDVRDAAGAVVDFHRTHRFRHTKATSLLNAGVPLHVVQRYLGHLSPEMTMIYAQTLASTHEAEFLRYRKLTADARELDTDPRDLYDMLQLDKRTDRILPNGWCLLPPRQLCGKGNACLTCDKFATDATFLPELTAQLARTEQLITQRRETFRARPGQDLGEDNIWLAGRRQEQDALGRIIVKLEHTRLADGTTQALRGAGASARTDAIAGQDLRRHDAR
jgi:integrase